MAENKDPNNLNNQQNSVGNSANNSFGGNNTPRLEDLLNQSSQSSQSSQQSRNPKRDAKKEKELKKEEELARKRQLEREKLQSKLFGGSPPASSQAPSQTPSQDARNENASNPTGQRPNVANPFGFPPIGQSAPRQSVQPTPTQPSTPTPSTPTPSVQSTQTVKPAEPEQSGSAEQLSASNQGTNFGLPSPIEEQKVQAPEPEDNDDQDDEEDKSGKQKQDKKYSFYTKKELGLLVKQAVKGNRDFTKNDILDIEERKLKDLLQAVERREQEHVEKVKEISKARGISSVKKTKTTPAVGGGPIRSIDDLFSAAKPVGAPVKEEQKSLQDYINELKERNFADVDPDALEQESEDLALEKDEIVARLEMIEDSRVEEEEGRRRRAGFIWFMLMGAFVVIVSLLGYYIYITFRPLDPQLVEVRVEMIDIDLVFNRVITDGTETRLEPIQIKPLDEFNLRIVARNVGDNNDLDFYLRFKIYIATKVEGSNGVEEVEHNDTVIYGRDNFILDWHKYNADEEAGYIRQSTNQPYVTADDGYVYYKGILERDEEVLLIDTLRFAANTSQFAGQQVEIVVLVEAVSYFDADIGSPTWDTAPREWVMYISQMQQELES